MSTVRLVATTDGGYVPTTSLLVDGVDVDVPAESASFWVKATLQWLRAQAEMRDVARHYRI